MERLKQVFLKKFTQRSRANLDVLISFVKSSVSKVRASYSENINLADKELVKLISVDAAFVVKLFSPLRYKTDMVDDVLSHPSIGYLHLDLILFENQLPLFVFEELFNIAFPPNLRDDGITFSELAYRFFSEAFDLEKPKHDLDNCRGVARIWSKKLKASKSKSPLDIKFSGHVLELPQILVMDLVTEALFFNMIAFEQIHCPFTSYITSYALVWSRLINTKEDVDVLVDNKIVRSFITNTEVVLLFRMMEKNEGVATLIT
ncbi:UPF0481 protein At3g47200-like [Neltuma alba]|uniref:UPF0481 protein At3g47200-like n=1 Tax=Neltuma alba TaxID=207710 RepID=UPI0010A4604A|nr:UPF0481 protein At3g47200-like [Prosopis alba]